MTLLLGDCLEQLKTLEDNSVDSIVTDPPYGLSFMGKKWDYDVPSTDIWKEALRVLKPGGHLLAFFGTRTYHRGVVRIEDASFEIRDQIQWIYGSGFPKSHNLKGDYQGWGSALKPANEPIVVARKPLEKGLKLAENVLKYGTGAINIDASRIELSGKRGNPCGSDGKVHRTTGNAYGEHKKSDGFDLTQGRWPANIIFDEVAAEMLDQQSGHLHPAGNKANKPANKYEASSFHISYDNKADRTYKNDKGGGASRFFYVAKASKRERNAGLEGMPEKEKKTLGEYSSPSEGRTASKSGSPQANNHPTVKPIKLMEYLIKLVTPPNGTTLDPFMGSGSTGVAAKNLGFKFIGIELSEEYFEIASKRIGA